MGKVRIFERRQLVEAYLKEDHINGPQYLVREIVDFPPDKEPLIDQVYQDRAVFIPKQAFEDNFKEVPELTGCCDQGVIT